MNAREYLDSLLTNIPLGADVDRAYVESRGYIAAAQVSAKLILAKDGGAEDGCTVGDILEEMPIDSNCGSDCKNALDSAIKLVGCLIVAHGTDERIESIIEVATECCLTYIRG